MLGRTEVEDREETTLATIGLIYHDKVFFLNISADSWATTIQIMMVLKLQVSRAKGGTQTQVMLMHIS